MSSHQSTYILPSTGERAIILPFSNDIIHKMWTNDEIIKSSTWRELKAVEITLKGCVDFFKTKFVKLFTDNQNVERISEVHILWMISFENCTV
jgi:hypothetical protein